MAAPITQRQREVVGLIARGLTYDEIGDTLDISRSAAKAHCDILRHKLGVEKKSQIPGRYFEQTGENPLTIEAPAPVQAVA